MINYRDCYGCGVCSAVCPKKCISMSYSKDGFIIPKIDVANCIDCHKCENLCPMGVNVIDKVDDVKGAAVWLKSGAELSKATSGGAVRAIARILAKEGFSFSFVRYNKNLMRAEHFCSDSVEDALSQTGTYYLQSHTSSMLENVLSKNDKKWMIVGTPCQIAGLRNVIHAKHLDDRFVLVDFSCHGVPSYNLFFSALRWKGRGSDLKKLDVSFRDKRYGWHDAWMFRLLSNGREIYRGMEKERDFFSRNFIQGTVQNRTCYTCPYYGINSSADIRVGDYWGGKYASREDGVSRVLALTKKGKAILKQMNEYCECEDISTNEVSDIAVLHNMAVPLPKERGVMLFLLRGHFGRLAQFVQLSFSYLKRYLSIFQ